MRTAWLHKEPCGVILLPNKSKLMRKNPPHTLQASLNCCIKSDRLWKTSLRNSSLLCSLQKYFWAPSVASSIWRTRVSTSSSNCSASCQKRNGSISNHINSVCHGYTYIVLLRFTVASLASVTVVSPVQGSSSVQRSGKFPLLSWNSH